MKIYISILSLCFVACSFAGHAQTVTPSITIGTHVLTLGMPESVVLEQLGSDLTISHPKTDPTSWVVTKKAGSIFSALGTVSFTAHRLSDATREWYIDIDGPSSKSFFYAIDAASKSLEHEGFTNCQLHTFDNDYMSDVGSGSGSLDSKSVILNCGMKRIDITLFLSDVPNTASDITVTESLSSR